MFQCCWLQCAVVVVWKVLIPGCITPLIFRLGCSQKKRIKLCNRCIKAWKQPQNCQFKIVCFEKDSSLCLSFSSKSLHCLRWILATSPLPWKRGNYMAFVWNRNAMMLSLVVRWCETSCLRVKRLVVTCYYHEYFLTADRWNYFAASWLCHSWSYCCDNRLKIHSVKLCVLC